MESFQARQAPTVIGPPKHYVHAKRRERIIHKCPATTSTSKGMTKIDGLPPASAFLAERPTGPPPPTDTKSSFAGTRGRPTTIDAPPDAPPRPPPHTPSVVADAVSLLSPSTKSRILELRRRKSVAASVLASSLAGFASPSSPSPSSRLDGSAVGGSEDDTAAGRRRRQLRRAASAPLGTTSSAAASCGPRRPTDLPAAVPPLPSAACAPPAGWRGSPSSRPRRASRRAASDRPPPASGSTTSKAGGIASQNAIADRRSLPPSASLSSSRSSSSSSLQKDKVTSATKSRPNNRRGTAGLAVVSHPRGSKSVVATAGRNPKSGKNADGLSKKPSSDKKTKKTKERQRRDGEDNASVRSAPSPRGKGGAGRRDYDKPWLATSTAASTSGGSHSAKKKTTRTTTSAVETTRRTTGRSKSSPSLGPKKPAYRRTSREGAKTVEPTSRRPSSTKGTPSPSSLRPKPVGAKGAESASCRTPRRGAKPVESSRPPPTKGSAYPTTPRTRNTGSEESSSCWTVVGSPNKCKSMPACTPPRHPVATPPPLSKLPSLEETEDESDFLLSAFEDPPSTPPRERGAAVSPPSLPPSSSVSAKKRRTRRKLSTTTEGVLGGPRGLGALGAKIEEIDAVLRGNMEEDDGESVDLWRLRELALSEGGLVNDALRKRAWPMLAGLHGKPPGADGRPIRRQPPPSATKASTAGNAGPGGSDIPPCQDDDLIEKDAKRTTSHLLAPSQRALHAKRQSLPYKDRKKLAARLRRKQRNLGDLIRLSLVPPPSKIEEGEVEGDDEEEEAPRYYQGYHDVASVFLSALRGGSDGSSSSGGPAALDDSAASSSNHRDLDLPARVLRSVLSTHLRDYARPTVSSLLAALRIIIMPLLELFDPDVHDRLLETDVEPYFALGWVASWFAHDVNDTHTAKRLCDAFLAGHPTLPFYVSIAAVSHPTNRERILNAEPDLPGVMGALQGLPRNSGRASVAAEDDDANVDDESSTGTCDAATVGSLDGSLASLSDASESSSSFLDRGGSTDASSHPSAGGDASVVPMQELIDLAVSYMERAPPQNLLSISRRYHKEYSDDDLTETTLLPDEEASTTVHLFRSSPPKSVAASTCPSERALERASLEEKVRTTRRARRRRLELRRGASLPSDVGRAGEASSSSPSSASPSLSTGASRRRDADSSDHCRAAKIAAGVMFDDEESGPTMDRARSALKSASAALFSGITWALGKAEQMPPQ